MLAYNAEARNWEWNYVCSVVVHSVPTSVSENTDSGSSASDSKVLSCYTVSVGEFISRQCLCPVICSRLIWGINNGSVCSLQVPLSAVSGQLFPIALLYNSVLWQLLPRPRERQNVGRKGEGLRTHVEFLSHSASHGLLGFSHPGTSVTFVCQKTSPDFS